MKLILIQDVKGVGSRGSLITTADGYAQNVLIPKKLALPASAENLKRYEKEQESVKAKAAMGKALAEKMLSEMNGKTISISCKASEQGTLFKSLHEKDVAEAIKKEFKTEIPVSAITLPDGPIKKLGEHRAQVSIHRMKAEVIVEIQKL